MQNKISKTLKFLRKKQKLTLVKLAEKVGINTSSLSRIERGEINLSVDLLEKIAKYLMYLHIYFLMPPPFNTASVAQEIHLLSTSGYLQNLFTNLIKKYL